MNHEKQLRYFFLVVLLIAMGSRCMAQDTAKSLSDKQLTYSIICDTCKYKPVGNTTWRFHINAYPEEKEKMRISRVDSLKQYKVWFNPKYILWTSDSTFTILDKPIKK
jgi:hypothetical protein